MKRKKIKSEKIEKKPADEFFWENASFDQTQDPLKLLKKKQGKKKGWNFPEYYY